MNFPSPSPPPFFREDRLSLVPKNIVFRVQVLYILDILSDSFVVFTVCCSMMNTRAIYCYDIGMPNKLFELSQVPTVNLHSTLLYRIEKTQTISTLDFKFNFPLKNKTLLPPINSRPISGMLRAKQIIQRKIHVFI